MSIEQHILRAPLVVEPAFIIAVACFAGDIAAPAELVAALPADFGAAFLFVEQPAAGRGKLLAAALARRTTLPVLQAEDGAALEAGHIYVIPPKVVPTIARGRIHIAPAAGEIEQPADSLLISLAQEYGDKAIGVILSGGGSDRFLGIRAIRQAGGTTFAQYPGSARFPNMSISAIDTGCIDFVLRPNEIARELTRIGRHEEKAPRGAFGLREYVARQVDSEDTPRAWDVADPERSVIRLDAAPAD
jgi:two-component system, chemotaxis family, CheB/CheR fusion protein